MTVQTDVFRRCNPLSWEGRYTQNYRRSQVFHLKHGKNRLWPVVFWERGNVKGTCAAVECDSANQLAEAVKTTKQASGGMRGGSFVINEFGQVLVPSSKGHPYFAGELNGQLLFDNPFDEGKTLDLGECGRLETGDPWDLPCLGVPYKLSSDGLIYFCQSDIENKCRQYPNQQDAKLIRALQKVRGDGGCRFIVNPFGVVLTRKPQGQDRLPIFVGKINYDLWFEKENERA